MIIDLEQIDPFSLPSFSLQERIKLPDIQAIYFAISQSSGILYIGKASILKNRWISHNRLAQLELIGDVQIAWIPMPHITNKELIGIESICIEHFNPSLNWTPIPTKAMLLKQAFGKNLTYLRKRRRISQDRLAELVGRSHGRAVRAWEHGDDFPSAECLEELCKELGVSIRTLFDFDCLDDVDYLDDHMELIL